VPVGFQEVIQERLSRYDYSYHGVLGDNPNLLLLQDRPDVADYLLDRMCMVGTEAQLRSRLAAIVAETDLDGIWLCAQEVELVRRLAEVLP
jgi:hypothetical protein